MPVIDNPEIYRAVLDNVPAGVCVVDRGGKIQLWNGGAERITGFLRQDVVGHTVEENILGFVDTENIALAAERLPLSIVLREGRATSELISVKHKAGHRILVRLHAAPLRDEWGKLVGAMESFVEGIPPGSWEERQDKLAAYGCLDQASGVLNHGMVQSHLRETLVTFEEHQVPFSILCIAIDKLEEIEHRFGSGAVTEVIRSVGQTLENSLRPTDFVGRWMDNEFLAILTECGEEEIAQVGERLRKMVLQNRVKWWGDQLQVTVSAGAAPAKAGDSVEGILIRAENGLQQSIKQGGNRLTVWDEPE